MERASGLCFVLWSGGGNVTATMPIVERLAERGHATTVLGDPSLAADVLAPTRFVPFRAVPPNDGRDPAQDAIRDWDGRTPIGGAVRGARWLFRDALRVAEDVVDLVRDSPVDAVVADTMLPGALMAAEALGVRSVSLVHSVWSYPTPGSVPVFASLKPGDPLFALRRAAMGAGARRLFELTRPAMNRERARLGLGPTRRALDQYIDADCVLVLSSPAFDFVPTTLPPHVSYVGPTLRHPGGEWQPAPDDRPLVLVSLSTTYQAQRDLLERIATALGRLPVRGLVTSSAIDPSSIAAPSNVEVVAHAPHADVLPHSKLVVTHGGHGTTLASLAAGVPVLCLPHGRDQPGVATRAEAAGAGRLLRRTASVDLLAETMRSMLADGDLAESARALGRAIRGEGDGAGRAVAAIEALVTRPG